MAAEPGQSGHFPAWFQSGYFPPVWFAPGDEEHLTPDERREDPAGGYVAPRVLPPRARERRAAASGAGRAQATAAGVREAVRGFAASARAAAFAQPVRELVPALACAGRSAASGALRSEYVPVFADEELMALAACFAA